MNYFKKVSAFVGIFALVALATFSIARAQTTTDKGTFTASPFDGSIAVQQQKLEERVTKTADELKDSDKDGISDFDETSFFGSDPFNPSTAGGGVTDGARLLQGIDPVTGKAMNFEDPRTAGRTAENLFTVDNVSLSTKTSVVDGIESKQEVVAFSGTAPIDSYVTLYIFSTPVIVTVKSDQTGNWSYTMDQELDNGQHNVYVASVNNSGKIVAKSDAVPFVKEVGAVALGLQSSASATTSEGFGSTWTILIGAIILLFIILIAILIAGMRSNKKKVEETPVITANPVPPQNTPTTPEQPVHTENSNVNQQ